MSSTTTDPPNMPPVQKMRRGTRSCRECRRRKIRCIYTSDKSQVCKECLHHGHRCVSQGQVLQPGEKPVSDNRPNLRIRVAQLESMIERLAKAYPKRAAAMLAEGGKTPEDSSPPKSPSHIQAGLRELDEIDIQSWQKSPLFGLFDNEVLVRSNGNDFMPMNTSSVISFGSAHLSDREKLLSTIAQEPHYLQLLEVAGSWWVAWQDHYSGLKDVETLQSLQDFVKARLAEERPIVVACGLCCIAMSLQHLRQGIDDGDLHLSASPKELMDRILAAVDQLVLSNDEYTTSIEGLDTFLLRGKIFAESNQLRKAWLHIRKATHIGQKIDLASSGRSPADALERQRLMGSLFETDRNLSMVLGLPYAVDDNFNDKLASHILDTNAALPTRMRALRRVTAIAAGRVNDRNANFAMDAATTLDIQRTLDKAAASMPSKWWEVTTSAEHFDDPQASHEHLMAQLWFYQVSCFLQLPFMLKATVDYVFDPSRTACLHATRQLLKVYNTLRYNATISLYTCKCEDFQGLFASIVLMVGLLQYHSQGIEPIGSSFDEDLNLLDTVKRIFAFQSTQQGGSIAKQGLHIINTLASFLQDDLDFPSGTEPSVKSATLFVPYFGTITVQSGPNIRRPDGVTGAEPTSLSTLPSRTQNSATLVATKAHLIGETSLSSDTTTTFGQHSVYSGYVLPMCSQYSPYRGDEDIAHSESVEFDHTDVPSFDYNVSSTLLDWDSIMYGSELNQQWNCVLPDTINSV